MRNRISIAVAMMITAMLACYLPGASKPPGQTIITSITVSPSSGEKNFSLEVKYEYVWDREYGNAEIFCSYTTPGGKNVSIGGITPEGLDRNGEKFSRVQVLDFSIVPADEIIELGVYTASCATLELGSSTATTNFIVVQNATPTPEPPSQPAATPTATLQTATLKGRIIFDYNTYQSARPSGGGELDRVTNWCIPEVTITPDGVISGTCEFYGTADVYESTVNVVVAGIAVQGGSFNFTYDVMETASNGWDLKPGETPSVPVWSNEAKWAISYTGDGSFTSATQASGTATFDFSCDSGAENLNWCWQWPRESFSGTITWSFVPLQ